MVPIAQEYAGFTAVCLSLLNEPITECFSVVVVDSAVAFQSKMYVSETSSSFKKCHS